MKQGHPRKLVCSVHDQDFTFFDFQLNQTFSLPILDMSKTTNSFACFGLGPAYSFLVFLFNLSLALCSHGQSKERQPNIVFILADDLGVFFSLPNNPNKKTRVILEGFNDVPWNNADLYAPNLARLAAKSTILVGVPSCVYSVSFGLKITTFY